MTMKDTNQSAAPEAEGVDRRVALKRLGLATGGVAASSWVLGSFASPAGAAMGWSAIKCGPGNTVTIPKSRKVFFDVGGGGGGGNKGTDRNGANGGAGAQVTGSITASASPYDLTVAKATGGTPHPSGWDYPGVAGTG